MPNLSFFETHQADYYDAETLGALWLTTPEAVRALLPSPLVPMEIPLLLGYVARFPKTSFDTPYMMGGLFMFCKYKGEVGTYVLSAPENDDFPVFSGREILGYPKKMAHLEMNRDGNTMSAFIERRGIRLVEIKAVLDGQPNNPMAKEILAQMSGSGESDDSDIQNTSNRSEASETQPFTDGINFLFKYAHSAAEGKDFEWPPVIVRQVTRQRLQRIEMGSAEVVLNSSPYDSPWGKVPIAQMLGATYMVSHNTMMPPSVVGDVNEKEFLPFSYLKYEW